MVWLFGRIYCTGTPDDYKTVHELQDKFEPTPLSSYGKPYKPLPAEVDAAIGPRIIAETRKYIRDFERLAMQTTTERELYDTMLKLYPDWISRGALWSSVRAIRT